MNINQALGEAASGRAILFTGAGFSKGARNIEDSEFMSGVDLARYLCSKCDIDDPIDLDQASDIFLDEFDEDTLIAELRNKYTVKNVADPHVILSELDWKRIYTTNYDNVLEQAYVQLGKKLISVTLGDNIYDIDLTRNICVHINGFIDRLNRATLKDEFKLTNTSYLTDSFLASSWISLFRSDLRTVKAIFFCRLFII